MTTKKMLWLFILSTLAMLGHTIGGQSITGVLEVRSSGTTIITVLGCMEQFLCEGEGTDINWRFFGTSIAVTNTPTRQITTIKDPDTRMVSSNLTFTEVELGHGDTYTCNIIDAVTRTTTTRSARLTVNDTRVYVDPIENIDISSNTIGDRISVGCSLQTCEPEVIVNISRVGQNIEGEAPRRNENGALLVNTDFVVSESTAGMYECLIRIPGSGMEFSERFNITGTPQRPPETMAPTNGGGNTNRPSNRNGATTLYGLHLPLFCLVVLLSVYLTNARL